MQSIRDAIALAAPIFNAGDASMCATIYASLSESLLQPPTALAPLHSALLSHTLASLPPEPTARAWALRHALDYLLVDEGFRPRLEAPLPAHFPPPGPLAHPQLRLLPAYRAARGPSFPPLFQHISSRSIAMTCPVVSTLSAAGAPTDMAFLYPTPATGAPGPAGGAVTVLDVPAATVLSLGLHGETSPAMVQLARQVLTADAARRGLRCCGAFQTLGYNSPMVPNASRYWELQVPVVEEKEGAPAGQGP